MKADSFKDFPPSGALGVRALKGKVVFRVFESDYGELGIYYYRDVGGNWRVLSDRISNINLFLNTEFSEAEFRGILRGELANMFVDLIGSPRAKVVSQFHDLGLNSEMLDRLRASAGNGTGEMKIEESTERWALVFYVIQDDGSLEEWNVSGRGTDARIDKFCRVILLPKNSIHVPDHLGPRLH